MPTCYYVLEAICLRIMYLWMEFIVLILSQENRNVKARKIPRQNTEIIVRNVLHALALPF
jgi:hypothetical protein